MSGETSAEVSVPTDLTVTSDGDSEEGYAASRRHARELQALAADRAELQRLVEKQKLELQSRDARIAALVAQHETLVANAIAKKDNDISTKQIKVNRLEAELLRTKEELNTMRERAARELAQLTQKCAVFQENQKRLTLRQEDIRGSLSNLQLSEEEFTHLRSVPVQQLTLQQYTSLRVYELVWPLRLKVKELQATKSSLESLLSNKDLDLQSQNTQCLKLQKDVEELLRKSEYYSGQLMDLRDEQREDDFKVRNFNRVKSERNQLEEDRNSALKKLGDLELQAATLKKERNFLEERCNEYKNKLRKHESDSSSYQNDLLETKSKLDKITEDLDSVNKSLRSERDRCEELHEKYITARMEITSLSENNQDLEHALKIAKERLQSRNTDCSNLQADVDHLSAKNRELGGEVEKFKAKYDSEVRFLEGQLKDMSESHGMLLKTRDELLHDNNKFHQDNQELETLLNKERLLREKEITTLEEALRKCRQSLSEYQALETEYAKNIRAAAALPENHSKASLDRILPGHAIAASKALEQNVQLTRRILTLERQNTEAASIIQQLTDALDQLKGKLASYKSALGLAGQPASSLLERVALLEEQAMTLQTALQSNTVSKITLEEENKTLTQNIRKMHQTIEKLTLQEDELSAIKHHLFGVKQTVGQFLNVQEEGEGPGVSISRIKEEPISSPVKARSPAKAIIITKNVKGPQLS